MSKTIFIWGAGRIGRGFIADLFHAAGWRLILVDRSQELVERLSRAGRYTIVRAEGANHQQEMEIAGYATLTTTQAGDVSTAITDADLLAVAETLIDDDTAAVQALYDRGLLRRALDEDAVRWQEQGTEFWAVVVAPWVLVQEI